MENDCIAPNIYICYSPDEQIYFLERRKPFDWATSQDFNTPSEAETAYRNNEIDWEEE